MWLTSGRARSVRVLPTPPLAALPRLPFSLHSSSELLTHGSQSFHMLLSGLYHSSSYLGRLSLLYHCSYGMWWCMQRIHWEEAHRKHVSSPPCFILGQALSPWGFLLGWGSIFERWRMGNIWKLLLPECVLSGTGSTSNFCSQGLESIPQLCNENRVLREENRRLQAQLSHVSRGTWSKPTNCGHY